MNLSETDTFIHTQNNSFIIVIIFLSYCVRMVDVVVVPWLRYITRCRSFIIFIFSIVLKRNT